MADQQSTVVKKGEDPLTGDYTPPPSTKQDEPDSAAQQRAEERSIGATILTTTSSAPRSIMNGESVTQYGSLCVTSSLYICSIVDERDSIC